MCGILFVGRETGNRQQLFDALKALAVEWSSVDQFVVGRGQVRSQDADCIFGGECVGCTR